MHRGVDGLGAQLRDRPHHQRGLPHLPWRQHVTEFAGTQRRDELAIRCAWDVARRLGGKRSANDEETRGILRHVD